MSLDVAGNWFHPEAAYQAFIDAFLQMLREDEAFGGYCRIGHPYGMQQIDFQPLTIAG